MTNLHQIIREIVTSTDEADPRVIAAEVLKQIPTEDYADLMLGLLVPSVTTVFREIRNDFGSTVQTPAGPADIPSQKVPAPVSRKVRRLREQNFAKLGDRVYTAPGKWMLLGDCGLDDLTSVVTALRAHAEATERNAQQYEIYAKAVADAGVAKMSDLPNKTLAVLFS